MQAGVETDDLSFGQLLGPGSQHIADRIERVALATAVAKADLVPTSANLLADYGSFAELEAACAAFGEQVNARPHRVTRRPPVELLAEERARLHPHPLPPAPFTGALGVTRRVGADTPMVAFETGSYSVPHQLAGRSVWVRRHGEQVVVVHVGTDGPVEVARHSVTTPGRPRVADGHFPQAPPGALGRQPRARTRRRRRSSPSVTVRRCG